MIIEGFETGEFDRERRFAVIGQLAVIFMKAERGASLRTPGEIAADVIISNFLKSGMSGGRVLLQSGATDK